MPYMRQIDITIWDATHQADNCIGRLEDKDGIPLWDYGYYDYLYREDDPMHNGMRQIFNQRFYR